MNSNYFQAIIQLRNPTDEAIAFLDKSLGSELSKVEKVRNGLDFYVKDKKIAEVKARKVRDRFGGAFNVAASLHTRNHQTSKDLYRLSILIRMPNFKKGEVLKIDSDLFRINGLGKKVDVLNLKNWKKKVLNYPEKFEILKPVKAQVVRILPEVEVLHPSTYQPVTLLNKPREDLEIDSLVDVIIDDGVYFI